MDLMLFDQLFLFFKNELNVLVVLFAQLSYIDLLLLGWKLPMSNKIVNHADVNSAHIGSYRIVGIIHAAYYTLNGVVSVSLLLRSLFDVTASDAGGASAWAVYNLNHLWLGWHANITSISQGFGILSFLRRVFIFGNRNLRSWDQPLSRQHEFSFKLVESIAVWGVLFNLF